MARKLIVLALVFVAIVGLASAQSPTESPKVAPVTKSSPAPDTDSATPPPTAAATTAPTTSAPAGPTPTDGPTGDDASGAADGPIGDDVIGAVEGAGPSDGPAAVAAPLGGPESANAYVPTAAEADGDKPSGAGVLEVSAVAAVAAVAGFFL